MFQFHPDIDSVVGAKQCYKLHWYLGVFEKRIKKHVFLCMGKEDYYPLLKLWLFTFTIHITEDFCIPYSTYLSECFFILKNCIENLVIWVVVYYWYLRAIIYYLDFPNLWENSTNFLAWFRDKNIDAENCPEAMLKL